MKEPRLTYTLSVQPASWENHDPHGCTWAIDLSHAERLAAAWGELCTLWACPPNVRPFALSRVG